MRPGSLAKPGWWRGGRVGIRTPAEAFPGVPIPTRPPRPPAPRRGRARPIREICVPLMGDPRPVDPRSALLGGGRRATEPNAQTRAAEDDFIARVEADAAAAARHRQHASVADDAGAMLAAIVVQPERAGRGLIGDVRVAARHGRIGVAGSFEESDVIRANEPLPAVAHLGAAADVDTALRERVREALGAAVQADILAGAVQLEGILETFRQLEGFGIAGLEPTTFVCFDDQPEVASASE